VDAKDQEMGTLEDFILDTTTMQPTHFILGGGFFEEYLESTGSIDDIDELAPLEIVDHIDNDYIVLVKTLDELETTNQDGALPIEGIKYSKFTKLSLEDREGPISAEIIDYEFEYEHSRIVLNHFTLQDELRSQGYMQKFEFIVPIDKVSIQDQLIHLDLAKTDLIQMAQEQVEPKSIGRSIIQIN